MLKKHFEAMTQSSFSLPTLAYFKDHIYTCRHTHCAATVSFIVVPLWYSLIPYIPDIPKTDTVLLIKYCGLSMWTCGGHIKYVWSKILEHSCTPMARRTKTG